MSEAKEGKLFGRKKLLDPLLGTTEGTKITSTIIFYTSHALTVYSSVEPGAAFSMLKAARIHIPHILSSLSSHKLSSLLLRA